MICLDSLNNKARITISKITIEISILILTRRDATSFCASYKEIRK